MLHTNNSLSLEEAHNIAKKWLPPITEEDKLTILNAANGTENTFVIPLLRKYIELLRPYAIILGLYGENNGPHEADCVASGAVFFYGCLCYIMHFPNWGSHIEDIFLYNLLYILVDHYIDDVKINHRTKEEVIAQMFILINDPLAYETMTLVDPILKTIAVTYHKLITRCPTTKDIIIKLFQAEIEGLPIQSTNTLPRETYYDICLKKGGYTMQVLQHIVGNIDPDISEATFHLGTIMQLIDDLLDVKADTYNSINTIATQDLQQHGNLDNLWLDIMTRINQIDGRFASFIILYTVFAVYIPDRGAENYTEELRSKTTPLNLFQFDGSSLLVETIMSEIMIMEVMEPTNKLKNECE